METALFLFLSLVDASSVQRTNPFLSCALWRWIRMELTLRPLEYDSHKLQTALESLKCDSGYWETENLPSFINSNTHMNPGDRQREVVLRAFSVNNCLYALALSPPMISWVSWVVGVGVGLGRISSIFHLQLVQLSWSSIFSWYGSPNLLSWAMGLKRSNDVPLQSLQTLDLRTVAGSQACFLWKGGCYFGQEEKKNKRKAKGLV